MAKSSVMFVLAVELSAGSNLIRFFSIGEVASKLEAGRTFLCVPKLRLPDCVDGSRMILCSVSSFGWRLLEMLLIMTYDPLVGSLM